MYKLIALDLDGTLLDDTGSISAKDAKALRSFSQKGGVVVLASGRMTGCVAPFAAALGIDCPLIAYNGAMVKLMEAEKRAILYHNPLDSRHADIIIDYCESRRFFLNYYIDDVLYATCDSSLRKYADIYSQQTGAIYRFTDGLGRFKGGSPTKMILITDSENSDISRTRDFLYGYFSDMMGAKVNIARTNPEYLEFFNIETDKGVALAKVAKHYGVKREEIIAFGDGENDIPMLEYAGFSAAPSNARPAVKKSAGTVSVWSNNQSAVGKFLEGI